MEKNTSGINRIIVHLEEQERELLTAGLYEEAELVRGRLNVYRSMMAMAHTILYGREDDDR